MSINSPSNYPWKVVDSGVPARIIVTPFVHTPADSLAVAEFVARDDMIIECMEIVPGTCGSAGSSTIDVTDDTVSIFASIPTIKNDDTDGTRQAFYPVAAKAAIKAGSVVKIAFGTAGTSAANFAIALHAVSYVHIP